MRRNQFIILLVFLVSLTGCDIKGETTQMSIINSQQSSLPSSDDCLNTLRPTASSENSQSTDDDFQVDSTQNDTNGGVTDISALATYDESWAVVNIIPEKHLVVYRDRTGRFLKFIPFNLETMSLLHKDAFEVECHWSTSYLFREDYLIMYDNSFEAIRVYDIEDKQMCAEWDFLDESFMGFSSAIDSISVVDVHDDSQRLYTKEIVDGDEKDMVLWKHPDRTQIPIITTISQGKEGYAFVGMIYPAIGEQSIMCYGLMNNTGDIVSLTKREHFDVAIFSGGFVIYDTILPYGSTDEQSGEFVVYNADTMTTTTIKPESPEEGVSRKIQVSENGKYILTLTEDDCFRVYDTCTGTLIAKFKDQWSPNDVTQQIASISETDNAIAVLYCTTSKPRMYYIRLKGD